MSHNLKRSVTLSQPSAKRKRTYEKKRPSINALVNKAIARTRETKMVTAHTPETGINTLVGSYAFSCPVPAVGAESNKRVGNKIDPTGMALKMLFHNNTSTSVLVRAVVCEVFDAQQTNAQIVETFFETTGYDAGVDGTLNDLIRKVNREEVKVMSDEIINLGVLDAGDNVKIVKKWFKLNKQMVFGDSRNIDPITSRYALFLIARQANSDESTGSSLEVSFDFDFYYKD